MTLALLALIVFAGFLTEATVGFGATVVTVALGAFLLPIPELLAAFVPVNVLLSAYFVVRYPRQVAVRLLFLRIVPLMAVGVVCGRVLTRVADDALLQVVFGWFVVAVSVAELARLARRSGAGRPLPPAPASALLLLGGVVHGLFATGGPMAVYVAGRQIEDKGRFRATLAGLWLALNGLLVADFAAQGTLGADSVRTSAVLLAPLLAGLAAGEWLHTRVPPSLFRALLFVLLGAAGLLLALPRVS